MDENNRLLPIDAVRGIAMFFIGVSHISFYLINDSATLASHLRAIGFLATPNFLLMSGLACGYQLAASPTTATALRIVDRGLFAFLVGHLLVAGSLVYVVPPGTAFEHIVITDSIGVLLCMAPLLKHASAQRLLWIGAAVYVFASAVALSWHPTSNLQILLGAVLFSINDGSMPDVGWVSPTIAYMGIFLVGVGLGKLISRCRRDGRAEVLSVRLAAAGSIAVMAALAVNVARHFVKPHLMRHFAQGNWADVILATMNVRHDAPPTLGYALFYGGIGVALVGFLGLMPWRETASPLLRVVRLAAVIGRASFVSYVVQQWIIDFIPIWVGFDSWLTPATSPLYLALNTVIMFWVAMIWDRRKANRYMTFGLKPASRPAAERASATSSAAGTSAAPTVSRSPSRWFDSRVPLFVSIVLLVAFLNILALVNAPKLTPAKLSLVPTNPYPWAPAKVAGHDSSTVDAPGDSEEIDGATPLR
jgi:surface polysaccharide O-acyltransferase-like enzyme